MRSRVFLYPLYFSVLVFSGAVFAQDQDWTSNFFFENDLFADTDLSYTNGVRLTIVSPDLTSFEDEEGKSYPVFDWMNRRLRDFPFHPNKLEGDTPKLNVSASMGQLMFTPTDGDRSSLDENDRPYAGWMYLGMGLQARTDKELYSLEMNLGVIGPASLARRTQNLVHDLRGIPVFEGWHNQLKNEPGVMIAFEHKYRVLDLGLPVGKTWRTDFISHWGGAVGNVATYFNAGAEWRVGLNLPNDFGTSTLKPGGDSSTPGMADLRDRTWRFQAFIALDARAVAQNIFLDGNTFRDSHSVEKEPLVADIAVGGALAYKRWRLSYAHVYRTKEFVGQVEAQKYGSLSLSYSRPISF